MALPTGFRFNPTDEELVAYYLRRKVGGLPIEYDIIEINLYRQEPWDLPEILVAYGCDMEWYFFTPRDKKYANGDRINRATKGGFWKSTGRDKNVQTAEQNIGMKKTLVFYRRRGRDEERTDWVMHEYRLNDEECEKVHAAQELFVLCRVLLKKSGVGPRTGNDRGTLTRDDYIDREPRDSEPRFSENDDEKQIGDGLPPIVHVDESTYTSSVQLDEAGESTPVPFGEYILDEPSFSEVRVWSPCGDFSSVYHALKVLLNDVIS